MTDKDQEIKKIVKKIDTLYNDDALKKLNLRNHWKTSNLKFLERFRK